MKPKKSDPAANWVQDLSIHGMELGSEWQSCFAAFGKKELTVDGRNSVPWG